MGTYRVSGDILLESTHESAMYDVEMEWEGDGPPDPLSILDYPEYHLMVHFMMRTLCGVTRSKLGRYGHRLRVMPNPRMRSNLELVYPMRLSTSNPLKSQRSMGLL